MNLKLSKTITLLLLLFSLQTIGQPPEYGHTYGSEDFYMFPIRPNQPNTLAGNMGELRSSHFHAGLDIRTGGRVGLPVYAAADGYISRISITSGGYGKALYISHSNGEITVYAHLNRFTSEIAAYTKTQQYAEESLHVKLFPKKNELWVNKGDIIAYSGNSGSSGGPHLHFEIRDKNHIILNPLNYHFEEIKDSSSPKIKKIALSPFTIESRINGVFQRKEINVSEKTSGKYEIEDTIAVYGEIGFELLTYDKLDDANYKCGVSEIDFFIGDELVFNQKIDSLSFSEQRNILVHYNFERYKATGEKFHKLYIDDGNVLNIYATNSLNGKFLFEENCIYNAYIIVSDIYGNKSTFDFVLKCTAPSFDIPYDDKPTKISHLNNVLIINNNLKDSSIQIISENQTHSILPQYKSINSYTYLWDMNTSSANSIDLCDSIVILSPQHLIPSHTPFDFYSENINTHFRKNSLFDTLFYISNYTFTSSLEIFSIGDPDRYPLKKNIDLTITPKNKYKKEKTHIYKISGGSYRFVGGTWKEEQFIFSTRDFGNYTLLTDSISPTITPISLSKSKLKFKITDNLSGIKDFNVYVNEKWVIMDYDYKTNLIWDIDEFILQNENNIIKVIVTDQANNKNVFTSKIE